MNQPGVRVEPIITLAGDHEVNQVFFDNVRVPVANRVGEENQGWTVAKHLLEYERGSGGVAAGLKIHLNELKRVATQAVDGATPLIAEPAFARKLQDLEIRFQALEFTELSTLARLVSGAHPGSGASSAVQDRVCGSATGDRHAATRSGRLLRRAESHAYFPERFPRSEHWPGRTRNSRPRRI